MSTDETYASDLEEFVDKSIRRWAKQKKEHLEPKLTRNFNAVTNREFRNKTWKEGEAKGWRSDTWIGFIRVKIWAFYSILLDTVLKAGKIPFDLEPLPYEENMDRAWMQDRDRRVERMRDKIESQLAARKPTASL